MLETKKGKTPLLSFEIFAGRPEIEAAVSTREGGVSRGPYATLNLGLHVGDVRERVLENRRILAEALGIDPSAMVYANQVHGKRVAVVGKKERGRGALDRADSIPASDALVTGETGVALVILVADCVVLLFYDVAKGAIGAAHASWRGTLDGIAVETVRAMQAHFGTRPEDLLVGISPSIGPCCYEVGEEVADLFRKKQPKVAERILVYERRKSEAGMARSKRASDPSKRSAKPHLDLWEANRLQMIGCGIPRENIEMARLCTSCNNDRFYSYRKERGVTGRFCGSIMLR